MTKLPTMLYTGLVSVTFGKLPAEEIVALAVEVRLEGIEWGGDIHIPPGEIRRTLEVHALTESILGKLIIMSKYKHFFLT